MEWQIEEHAKYTEWFETLEEGLQVDTLRDESTGILKNQNLRDLDS
jgi:hypothetical protein